MKGLLVVLAFVLAIPMAFACGYWMGHYEALRCSCKAQTQHFLRRLLGLPLTAREFELVERIKEQKQTCLEVP